MRRPISGRDPNRHHRTRMNSQYWTGPTRAPRVTWTKRSGLSRLANLMPHTTALMITEGDLGHDARGPQLGKITKNAPGYSLRCQTKAYTNLALNVILLQTSAEPGRVNMYPLRHQIFHQTSTTDRWMEMMSPPCPDTTPSFTADTERNRSNSDDS